MKEFDEGTSAPPSQVCAENGIDYSRLKILLKSYAFNNIYTHGLIKPSNLELPEMDPYEKKNSKGGMTYGYYEQI